MADSLHQIEKNVLKVGVPQAMSNKAMQLFVLPYCHAECVLKQIDRLKMYAKNTVTDVPVVR